MKKRILMSTMVLLMSTLSLTVQASWWDETWGGAKESVSTAWESMTDQASEWKKGLTESDSDYVEDVKKLADKETYSQAWEGIKQSVKNPSVADVDENGIPKE